MREGAKTKIRQLTLTQRVQGSSPCAPTNSFNNLVERWSGVKNIVSALCPRWHCSARVSRREILVVGQARQISACAAADLDANRPSPIVVGSLRLTPTPEPIATLQMRQVGDLKSAGAVHFSQYEQMIQAAISGQDAWPSATGKQAHQIGRARRAVQTNAGQIARVFHHRIAAFRRQAARSRVRAMAAPRTGQMHRRYRR